MILTFFVPMVVVSCVLMVWQLHARRGEELDSSRKPDLQASDGPLRRAF
jgi:hypothetical protein